MSFVPVDFAPPHELACSQFELRPLDVQYNESDLAAWTSSTSHINRTPGWESATWPPADATSIEANRLDLQRHAQDFADRAGFTYTVLKPGTSEVIGCVYIYPAQDDQHDAEVRSWVRADLAHLDMPLYRAILDWLSAHWPFTRPQYAER